MTTGVEIIRPKDRERWLAVRGQDVTASVIAALFSQHPYVTEYELWALKTGRLRRSNDDSPAMERGRMLEPVAVELLRQRFPKWKMEHNAATNIYYRDPDARIGATPDVIVTKSPRGRGVIQIKSVEASAYRRGWIVDGEPEPPLWIAMQATLEAYLTGAQWAAVAPLVVSYGLDMPFIEIPLVPGVIDAMKARTREFWRMVAEGREPQIDYARDAATIEKMFAQADDESEVDLTGDERIVDLIRDRKEAADAERAARVQINAIDAEIKHAIGNAAVAHLPGGRRITWRRQRRAGTFIAPSETRVLRLPKEI